MSHEIRDNDNRFIVDADTRAITSADGKRLTVMQYDHNSEIVTFQMPRYIEGHDMCNVNLALVLFENASKGTSARARTTISGVYEMKDMMLSIDNPDILCRTWKIGRESTQLAGTLTFQLRFTCHEDVLAGIPEYTWHTNICTLIDVASSLNSGNDIGEIYPDVIAQLDERVSVLERDGVPQDRIETAVTEYFTANPVEKLTDEELKAAIDQYFTEKPVNVDAAIETAITDTYKDTIIAYVAESFVNGDEVSY